MSIIQKSAVDAALARIVREIEEDIVLGFLHPRQRLVEDELMTRFGEKRHVIRAALNQLVTLGIVERRKNIGAVVRSYDHGQITDLYDLRDLLESEAARRMACPAAPEDVARLREIQKAHDEAVQTGNPRLIFKANMAFHAALFDLCPNKAMVEAIRHHFTQTHAIRSASARSAGAQARSRIEHHAIIDALEQGRRDDLMRLCREHIRPARDEYLAINKHYFDTSALAGA